MENTEYRRLSLEDVTKIRIVVIPVGNIANEKFEYYFTLLSSFTEFELRNITIDYGKNKKNALPVLKKRDWKTSNICFDFIKLEWATTDDWEELQYHRRVLGVVGVLDCKEWSDFHDASAAFQSKIAPEGLLKNVAARMCLAVEPGENQRDLDPGEADNKTNFIMVPAHEKQRLQFYTKTLLLDFSSTILTHLENQLSVADPPLLLTPQDTNHEVIENNKRQKASRFTKQQGDLCLLLGSPADAQEFYLRAIEQCKIYQDMLWVAAATEGIAAAKLVEFNYRYPNWPKDKLNSPEVTEILSKVTESLDLYNKKLSADLQIELTIKLARLHIKLGDKLQASNLIMKAYAESDALSIQEKITLTSTIALLFLEINMKRKFSFFLRETALLCKKIVLPQRAYHLLKMVAPYYQVQLPFSENKTDEGAGKKAKRRETLYASGVVWKFIHATMFDDLIEVASEMKDPKIPIRYLISYLSSLGRHLTPAKQLELSEQLTKQTRRFPVMVASGSPGLLTLFPITYVAEVNNGGALIEIAADDDGGPSGPFIYRPKRTFTSIATGPEIPIVKVAKESTITIRVHLQNHFHFSLQLHQVELRTHGITCKPVHQIIIEPQAHRQLDFTVVVHEGDLIKSVMLHYRTFNCLHCQALKMDTHIKVLDVLASMKVVRVCPGGTKLKLFNGQELKMEYKFTNDGIEDIDFVNVEIEENYEPDDMAMFKKKQKMIFWDSDSITRNLPLKPGASFCLQFQVYTQATCKAARFLIRYGNTAQVQLHQRALDIPIDFTIDTGLHLLSFDVVECSAHSLKRFKEFPPHDNIIKEMNENFDENDTQPEYCLAVFDVVNHTKQPFHLECNKEKKPADKHDRSAFFHSTSFVTIESSAVRRVMVAMRRQYIHPNEMPAVDIAMKKYLLKEKSLTEAQYNTLCELQVYRDRLLERVSITWHSITENSQGLLRLDSLRLTESQLEHLKRTPLNVRLFPLSENVRPTDGGWCVRQHEFLNLGVEIKKICFDVVMEELLLNIVPCRLLSTSSFSWVNRINDVPIRDEKSPHSFLVCFHEKGIYQLIAHCNDPKCSKDYWSPTLEISVF